MPLASTTAGPVAPTSLWNKLSHVARLVAVRPLRERARRWPGQSHSESLEGIVNRAAFTQRQGKFPAFPGANSTLQRWLLGAGLGAEKS
jgi:hypothetical protein